MEKRGAEKEGKREWENVEKRRMDSGTRLWASRLLYKCVCLCVSCSVPSDFLQPHGARQTPLSVGFSRQEYWKWVSHSLLQGIFLTQGLNPGILHCRNTLYHLSHHGRPWRIPVFNLVLPGSSPVLLKCESACDQLGDLAQMQVWFSRLGWAWDAAFLTSSWLMLNVAGM